MRRPGNQTPNAWLPDDRIVFASTEAGNLDLYLYGLSVGGEPTPYLEAPWAERDFVLSPDGSLAAFVSTETESQDVWLRDFPTPEGKWRVSFGGGAMPRWAPDGRTLHYWRVEPGAPMDTLFAVQVERRPRVTVGRTEVVLVVNTNYTGWDIHPDGQRFLVTLLYNPETDAGAGAPGGPGGPGGPDRYLVVLNWFEELRQRTGGSR